MPANLETRERRTPRDYDPRPEQTRNRPAAARSAAGHLAPGRAAVHAADRTVARHRPQAPYVAPQAPYVAAQAPYQRQATRPSYPSLAEIPAAFQAPAAQAELHAEPSQAKSRAACVSRVSRSVRLSRVSSASRFTRLLLRTCSLSAISQPQTSGRVTLNNLDSATNVSGVALAATPSVVTLEVTGTNGAGSGSGVIYSKDGYIVTNAHVVTLDGAAGSDPEIRVWLSDGRILDGTLVGTDPFADLAVVKIEADDLVPIEVADSSEINVGDLAVAIGAPLNLSNTVTSGVVSALNRGIAVGSPILPQGFERRADAAAAR